MTLKYQRILVKLSGESLMGAGQFGYDEKTILKIILEIKKAVALGVQVAIVVGGGNICRGKMLAQNGLGLTTGDQMGMMATVMNALYLRDKFENQDIDTRVMTALAVNQVAEPFIRLKAIKHLNNKGVVILAGGTGNPFCTTDTASALRARELECDAIIKITKVDAIYTKDPNVYPDAKRIEQITFKEIIAQKLEVMDQTAFTMSQEANIPIVVCDVFTPNNIVNIAKGERIGTLIVNDE